MGTAARPTALVGLALIGTLVAAGCGADPTDPTGGDGPINPSPTGQGRFFIAWTIDGAAPTTALCGPIARLSLEVRYADVSYTIAPIPCVLDRFRYDGMPTGNATLTLTGLDSQGCALTTGGADALITPTKPTSPSPVIALPALRACP